MTKAIIVGILLGIGLTYVIYSVLSYFYKLGKKQGIKEVKKDGGK